MPSLRRAPSSGGVLAGRRTVEVVLSATVDIGSWQSRHASGAVPDALPYGLDRLSVGDADVVARLPPPRDGRGVLAGVERRVEGRSGVQLRHGGRRSHADVVLCWDERTGIPASARCGSRVVSGVIWLTDERAPSWKVRALQRAGRLFTLSTGQLPRLGELNLRGAAYVPMGIDATFFAHHPLPDGPGQVLSVGNDRDRDHATLVSAARHLPPGSSVTVVSGRPVPAADRVLHLPHLGHDALRDAYAAASVVAVATRPNLHCSGITAVLEAMASGRPVVVTRTPGMSEYVEHGVTGVLVPPGDAEAVGRAAADLLQDPDRMRAMGAAARERVEREHTTARQAGRLAALVADLL